MSETFAIVSREQILRRICGEYVEMPGLRLTQAQARRLWGLDEATCAQLLESLTQDGFLCRGSDNAYARPTDQEVVRNFQPVRGILRSEDRDTAPAAPPVG